MAPGKEVVSNRVVLFNFFKGHGQIKRSPIIVLNYNLIDYLNNSNLFNSYNPGQKAGSQRGLGLQGSGLENPGLQGSKTKI